MKNTDPKSTVSFHISGNYPLRELSPDERDEPCFLFSLPRGFECLVVAVYGHGLSFADVCESAMEWLIKHHPNALTEQEIADEANEQMHVARCH